MDPKIAPKLVILWSMFGSLLFEILELFGCLLGVFLSFLRLSRAALDPKNLKEPKVRCAKQS